MPKSISIGVGDWVRSCSPGIWQVVRQVPEHYDTRYALSEPQKLSQGQLLLLRRLVNDKWKKAFALETAHTSLVRPLTKADAGKLQKFLGDHPDVVAGFNEFQQPVDLVLNLGFSLPRKSDFRAFKKEFEEAFAEPLSEGMTSDAILKLISQSRFANAFNDIPRSATLQFACKNLEVQRKHFIYRELHIQNF